MEALALSLLRPTRRTRRGVVALVVVALLGWLGVAAGHLHLPGAPVAFAQVPACPDGHDGHDGHEHRDLRGFHATHAGHGPHFDLDGHDGDHRAGHERAHPCSICLSLERGAGVAAPASPVVALVSLPFELRTVGPPLESGAAPTAYRSRAPPVA
jgi:hypothetical protein